ncbi:MAG: hypothetical protein LRY59_06975 [Bacteroides graminisolvens]|nr:hypothetical protein [Bacteroides graminisolvens]
MASAIGGLFDFGTSNKGGDSAENDFQYQTKKEELKRKKKKGKGRKR